MPVQRVLAPTWEQSIADDIGNRDITVDTTFGPVRDIIARPVSKVADRMNQDVVHLSDILSLTNIEQFSVQELNDIAYNSQIIRGGGTASTAVVSLLSTSPPTSDVTIPINFPFSTEPDPQTGAVVFFAATQQAVYIAANANNFYDAAHRVYRLDIPVQCTTPGPNGNVGPNRIVKSQRAISGFQRITNFAGASPGTDQESNTDLADTLLIFNLGINDISTPYGIGLETKRQFPGIIDYKVIFGSDTLLTRASVDAGATDVYIIGSTAVTNSDSFTYAGQPLVLRKQPILSIISVTNGPTTYVLGTNYIFVPDLNGPYGGSPQGRDAIQFLPTSVLLPAIGDTVTVSYNYNSLISTIQNFFTSPRFFAIGRSLLYKQGQQTIVSVAGTLTVLPNFDANAVRANVVTAIINYVNSLKLGIPLEEFNLITYLGQTVGSAGGIDNFVLTTLNFQGLPGVLPLVPATGAQYLRTTINDVVVTLG